MKPLCKFDWNGKPNSLSIPEHRGNMAMAFAVFLRTKGDGSSIYRWMPRQIHAVYFKYRSEQLLLEEAYPDHAEYEMPSVLDMIRMAAYDGKFPETRDLLDGRTDFQEAIELVKGEYQIYKAIMEMAGGKL